MAGMAKWAVAEAVAKEVVDCVRPTVDSEEKRKEIIAYLQDLFRHSLKIELYPYGSVPLKTYLPDGDIDMTAFTSLPTPEILPKKVLAIIQGQVDNPNAEHAIQETRLIDAQVKLVKCTVDNIDIDISFNMLGGVSSLCFLEEVDRLVQKNHLLKRSIILVKTWCFYESQILGSSHGLMSTYAMETLILYIFQMYHSSLQSPLSVLYQFLEYFGTFDWDKYCISLFGPVRKSSLPHIVVELSPSLQNDFLISRQFLSDCIETFAVPSTDAQPRIFYPKPICIIDPLKEDNNLGRSISIANSSLIKSAFRSGAKDLSRILTLPGERMELELRNFFANTFNIYGQKRIDVADQPGRYSTDINCLPPAPPFYPQEYYVSQYCAPYQSFAGNGGDSFIWEQRDGQFQPCVGGYYDVNIGSLSNYSSSSFADPNGFYSKNLALHIAGRDCSRNLSDLKGDHDSNIRSFLCGRSLHEPPLCSDHRIQNPLNSFGSTLNSHRPLTQPHQSILATYASSSGYDSESSPGYSPYPTFLPGQYYRGYYNEENYQRPQGTGTYFPRNYSSWERSSIRMERYPRPGNYHPDRSAPIFPGKMASGEGSTSYGQLPEAQSPYCLENDQNSLAESISRLNLGSIAQQTYSYKDEDFPPLKD